MKYNPSEIMRAAHYKRRCFDMTFAQALHLAWVDAKAKAARYNVYGERFGMDGMQLLAGDVDYREAERTQWYNMCRFDRITITAL